MFYLHNYFIIALFKKKKTYFMHVSTKLKKKNFN